MNFLKRVLFSLTLFSFVFLAIFGLFVMSHMHHEHNSLMSNCPLMLGEQNLCSMDFYEHINLWKSLTTGFTSEYLAVFIPIIFISFLLYLRPPNFSRNKLYIKPNRENYITSLFSQGILNSKAP